MASSTPGIYLVECGQRCVYSSADAVTHAESKVLHHVAHATETRHGLLGLLATSIEHISDRAVRINLHGAQVVEAIDQTGVLSELLVEGIGQVVGRIGRDEEDILAVLCELNGQGTRGGGLSDTTLTADEDPAERLLIEDVLQRGGHLVVCVDKGGHVGGYMS